MSRIELSITTDYVKSWDAWTGIREWVQNARDAEIQFNAPMKIDWYNDTLRIENADVTLPRESLLLGYTSKGDRADLAGFWGEGYKIGTLALVRAGHPVKIRSGSEVWTPSIERSERYAADVLVFNIEGGRKDEKRVRVEIGKVSKEEWESIKTLFLFLDKKPNPNIISTKSGDLLLGEEHRGKIFVKGIFVQNTRLNHGYNFKDAKLDRDRKMVEHWEQTYRTAAIWKEAAAKRPDLIDAFFAMLEANKEDVQHIGDTSYLELDQALAQAFADRFKERNGEAIPVSTLAETQEVEHLGARGVIVSKSLGAVLRLAIGGLDEIKDKLRKSVKRRLNWHELTTDQKESLQWAVATLSAARDAEIMNLVDVVEFADAKLLGQYDDGRLLLSVAIVDDPEETLATLIHEYAHKEGGDGEAAHVAAIERLWTDVVRYLRKTRNEDPSKSK